MEDTLMAITKNVPTISPTEIATTDEDVRTAILEDLVWDSGVDESDITVEAENGIVTLAGTVPSSAVRSRAALDAWGVIGVNQVINRLSVSLPDHPPPPDDLVIRGQVEDMLEHNPNIEASDISVNVRSGVVTLGGTVPTHYDKNEAEALAAVARGVILVENELVIVPTDRISDEQIADQVVMALRRSAQVDADQIEIIVDDGVVTLNGSVPNAGARLAAARAVTRGRGVVEVENNLTVLP